MALEGQQKALDVVSKTIRMLLAAGFVTTASAKDGDGPRPMHDQQHAIVSAETPLPQKARFDFGKDTESWDFGNDLYDFGQQARLDSWISKRGPRLHALRDKIDAGIKRMLDSAARCNEEKPNIDPYTLKRLEMQFYKVLGGRNGLLPIDKKIFDSLTEDTTDEEMDALIGVEKLHDAEDAAEQILQDVEHLLRNPEMPNALKHILVEGDCLVS